MQTSSTVLFWEQLLRGYAHVCEKHPKEEYQALAGSHEEYLKSEGKVLERGRIVRECYRRVVKLEQSSFEGLHDLLESSWRKNSSVEPTFWGQWLTLFVYEPAYFARAVGFIEQYLSAQGRHLLGAPLLTQMVQLAEKKMPYEQKVGLMGSFELLLDMVSFTDLQQWKELHGSGLDGNPTIAQGERSMMDLPTLMGSKILEQWSVRQRELEGVVGTVEPSNLVQSAGWGKRLTAEKEK